MADTLPAPERQPRRSVTLVTIRGIRITLDYSWFFIFLLVLWSLAVGYFPFHFPGEPTAGYWLASALATVLLFFSVIFHELSHSFVALNAGIKIPEITLFIFGGVSRISQDAPTPQTEFRIAVAGPLSSFFLGAVFGGIALLLHGKMNPLGAAVFNYLAFINILLGLFNLVPGFPLDGGRVLRSLIWWRTGSIARATRIASEIGKGFGLLLMLLGIFGIFTGSLIGGIWFFLIGLFLRGIASREYQELMVRKSLEGVHVREVMLHDVVTVPPDLPLDRLVNEYFITYCYRGFPVLRDGEVLGIVNLADVRNIPEEQRGGTKVEQIMVPLSEAVSVHPELSLVEALNKMNTAGTGRLLVTEKGRLSGMVTKAGLLRYLEIRNILRR